MFRIIKAFRQGVPKLSNLGGRKKSQCHTLDLTIKKWTASGLRTIHWTESSNLKSRTVHAIGQPGDKQKVKAAHKSNHRLKSVYTDSGGFYTD